MQIRMLVPFIIPFVLFSILIDVSTFFPGEEEILSADGETLWATIGLILTSFAFLGLMMVFLPAFIQYIWKCRPIQNQDLHDRLESFCERSQFKHAGMRTWTLMNHALTAGIIGIVPRFRYVMFTGRLLRELSPDAIEAILAHEIGHSQKKHLLIYPVIIFGMIVILGLFTLFFWRSI